MTVTTAPISFLETLKGIPTVQKFNHLTAVKHIPSRFCFSSLMLFLVPISCLDYFSFSLNASGGSNRQVWSWIIMMLLSQYKGTAFLSWALLPKWINKFDRANVSQYINWAEWLKNSCSVSQTNSFVHVKFSKWWWLWKANIITNLSSPSVWKLSTNRDEGLSSKWQKSRHGIMTGIFSIGHGFEMLEWRQFVELKRWGLWAGSKREG